MLALAAAKRMPNAHETHLFHDWVLAEMEKTL
jgi:hypothetical protein